MCFSSPKTPTYSTPPAPEPTPESVAPATEDTGADSLKIKRKGLTSKRTDLNVPSVGTSGQGLNVPV